MEKVSAKQKSRGAIYTPATLATWLADHARLLGCKPTFVFDPAAGEGALLEAAKRVFPKVKFGGLEIDSVANRRLREIYSLEVKPTNALTVDTWNLSRFREVLIFANPPWGADFSKRDRSNFKNSFMVAKGLFDSYDLFIERIIKELPPKSWAAIFVPDSLLLKQHSLTRDYISKNTQIKSIVRLPEGVFPGVAMGSLAIVLRKCKPTSKNKVLISRIPRFEFFQDLQPLEDLKGFIAKNCHKLNQLELALSENDYWNLEPKSIRNHSLHKNGIIQPLRSGENSNWDLWFHTGRGLELGKKSNLMQPIKSGSKSRLWVPVLVGEDINRRSASSSRVIRSDAPGIDFKKELTPQERLLVRKTGIGIKAVVSKLATTQTIYHFSPRKTAPNYALHYAAGFLTSRVIIALHLSHTGETEWRSHPYVTQRTIREIELPIPRMGSRQERLAIRISEISRKLHTCTDGNLENELDSLVCELIGANSKLQIWAYEYLSKVRGCSYIQELVSEVSFKRQVA
jgi:adenine-specific DNA-methyltransferase